MSKLKTFAAASLCAGALLTPQIAAASLIDENITVRFDWDSLTDPQIDVDTQDTTASGPGGIGHTWSYGDGTELDDYFLSGDSLTIGTDAVGDFVSITAGSSFAWGPMTLIISGWEETLLDVTTAEGEDILTNPGVSSESLSALQWSASLNFSASTDNLLYFSFQEDTGGHTTVPLPAGAVLLLSGLGGLAIARRRRK